MLNRFVPKALTGLAIVAGLFGCTGRNDAQISAANAANAKAVGERLAAQDRANEERHRAEIAKLIEVHVVAAHADDRLIRMVVHARNFSAKQVDRVDVAVIDRTPEGATIGTTELHWPMRLAPHESRDMPMTFSYMRFGEDTGAVREALGKPQRFELRAKEIKYADGSDAGYDD